MFAAEKVEFPMKTTLTSLNKNPTAFPFKGTKRTEGISIDATIDASIVASLVLLYHN